MEQTLYDKIAVKIHKAAENLKKQPWYKQVAGAVTSEKLWLVVAVVYVCYYVLYSSEDK